MATGSRCSTVRQRSWFTVTDRTTEALQREASNSSGEEVRRSPQNGLPGAINEDEGWKYTTAREAFWLLKKMTVSDEAMDVHELQWKGSVVDNNCLRIRFYLRDEVIAGQTIPLRQDEQGRLNLEGADFQGIYINDTNLEHVNLNGALLKDSSLRDAIPDGARLNDAHLERDCLDKARLTKASLYQTCLDGAGMERAKLDGAILKRASLQQACMKGVSNDITLFASVNLKDVVYELPPCRPPFRNRKVRRTRLASQGNTPRPRQDDCRCAPRYSANPRPAGTGPQ